MKKFNMSIKWQMYFKEGSACGTFENIPDELKTFLKTELMDIITDYITYDKSYSVEIKIKSK